MPLSSYLGLFFLSVCLHVPLFVIPDCISVSLLLFICLCRHTCFLLLFSFFISLSFCAFACCLAKRLHSSMCHKTGFAINVLSAAQIHVLCKDNKVVLSNLTPWLTAAHLQQYMNIDSKSELELNANSCHNQACIFSVVTDESTV